MSPFLRSSWESSKDANSSVWRGDQCLLLLYEFCSGAKIATLKHSLVQDLLLFVVALKWGARRMSNSQDRSENLGAMPSRPKQERANKKKPGRERVNQANRSLSKQLEQADKEVS